MIRSVRTLVKALLSGAASLVAAPAAATCWLENRTLPANEGIFVFWTHVYALLPGRFGMFLRRAFYVLTLDECSPSSDLSFGMLFSHRGARVEDDVYVGPYAVIGRAHLRKGTLIGTRASIPSGSAQHEFDEQGRFKAPDRRRFEVVEIGPYAWIGEAATVMAHVGEGSVVAAGAVVSAAVPPRVVVAGNPARFVRSTVVPPASPPAGASAPGVA